MNWLKYPENIPPDDRLCAFLTKNGSPYIGTYFSNCAGEYFNVGIGADSKTQKMLKREIKWFLVLEDIPKLGE